MKSLIFPVLALFALIVGCRPQASPTPVPVTPTSAPPPVASVAPTPSPDSGSRTMLPRGTVRVDSMDRTYSNYVPAHLPHNAPLLFALHGAPQDGEMMRLGTGFEFEDLADEKGFVVAYPDGSGESWATCASRRA